MGLGLDLVADPPAGLEMGRLADLASVHLPLPGPLAPLCRVEWGAAWVNCTPCPLEEAVEFRLDAGRLTLGARTASLGPGYHAALVAALDRLATAADFSWRTSEDAIDEGGYRDRRDFGALQAGFGEWFTAVARQVAARPGGVAVSMALDALPSAPAFALTPLGPRNAAFFATPLPARHFPWWDEGLTPAAAHSLAEALAWSRFPWRAPLLESEPTVGEAMRALHPDAPWRARLDQVLTAGGPVEPQTGPWYLCGPVRQLSSGGWTVVVPGYFYQEWEDDSTQVFWFGDRTVWLSTLTIDRDDFDAETAVREAESEIAELSDGCARFGDFAPHLDNGWQGTRLGGKVETAGRIAVCSVLFRDPAHRGWAMDVLRSLNPSR